MTAGSRGRVLTIAGSDSGGGAGIQADVKTITALGGYAATAVTAITVQNTLGVSEVYPVPPAIVAAQIKAVLSDIGADAIKTGMLADAATTKAVIESLSAHGAGIPLIIDPVMVAKGGARLLDERALGALRELIRHGAALLTPNLPEAEVLTGRTISTVEEMRGAIDPLLDLGASGVLLKGGHLRGSDIVDIYADNGTRREWRGSRIETRNTHGTGCTLASAIAAGVARGVPMIEAIERARRYVRKAIETAPGFGKGHGPLNHAFGI
ncbi:MAG: bifunctional hydroxymethylpyrimidine kinase/phosphomethylpyrimidine kinase [Alphaproteobacteria bacterium]|nr:bifunctional hydroxymethylpyrimidine kinase/phosphomethylpyrimidine kinase [Alphaproteobacteria bacterium]